MTGRMTREEFLALLGTLAEAERLQFCARALRAVGADRNAAIMEAGQFPPIEEIRAEFAEVKRQEHADEVTAELLADIDI